MLRQVIGGRVYGSEQDTLKAILLYLLSHRIPAIHHRNTGAIFQRAGQIRFGRQSLNQRGIADIIALVDGVAVAIEVKRFDGKLSTEQTDWLELWRLAGGVALVARHLDQVIDLVTALRASRRAQIKTDAGRMH